MLYREHCLLLRPAAHCSKPCFGQGLDTCCDRRHSAPSHAETMGRGVSASSALSTPASPPCQLPLPIPTAHVPQLTPVLYTAGAQQNAPWSPLHPGGPDTAQQAASDKPGRTPFSNGRPVRTSEDEPQAKSQPSSREASGEAALPSAKGHAATSQVSSNVQPATLVSPECQRALRSACR